MSGRCVCRDSKELLVGSSVYADCYGPGRPAGGVHVPVGIRLKRSDEENSWNRNQNTSPNYLLRGVWQAQANQSDAAMLWAAACMCYFGFLRSGEVVVPSASSYDPAVHMSYGDVRVNDVGNPQYLEVRIKASKTDPFRKGVTVYLGRTEQEVCPVAAILGYMVRRGQANGPFFKFSDDRYLTRARFVDQVRSALSQAGLTAGEFAGHSFRIVTALELAQPQQQRPRGYQKY